MLSIWCHTSFLHQTSNLSISFNIDSFLRISIVQSHDCLENSCVAKRQVCGCIGSSRTWRTFFCLFPTILFFHINILKTKINVLIAQQNVCHVLCSKISTLLLLWIAYLCVLPLCSYNLFLHSNLFVYKKFCVSRIFNLCMHCQSYFAFNGIVGVEKT